MSKEVQAMVRAFILLGILGALVLGADPALIWTVVWAAMTATWNFWTVYASWILLVSSVCTVALFRYLFASAPETPGSTTK